MRLGAYPLCFFHALFGGFVPAPILLNDLCKGGHNMLCIAQVRISGLQRTHSPNHSMRS